MNTADASQPSASAPATYPCGLDGCPEPTRGEQHCYCSTHETGTCVWCAGPCASDHDGCAQCEARELCAGCGNEHVSCECERADEYAGGDDAGDLCSWSTSAVAAR